jgi:hypothetical protein
MRFQATVLVAFTNEFWLIEIDSFWMLLFRDDVKHGIQICGHQHYS